MDQVPFILAVPGIRRSPPEKSGVRQIVRSDFDDVMTDQHKSLSRLPDRDLEDNADAPVDTGERRPINDAITTPVELTVTPPLEFHLEIFIKLAGSPDQSSAQAGDQISPKITGRRQQGSLDRDIGGDREIPQRWHLVNARQDPGDLKSHVLSQLVGALHRPADVTPSSDRMTGVSEIEDSEEHVEALQQFPDIAGEEQQRPLRVRMERDERSGWDSLHKQPGQQQDALTISPATSVSQTSAAPIDSVSPAHQISQHLNQLMANMAGTSKGPGTGAEIKALKIILEPEQLGTVHVSLTLRSDGLHVKITADKATTAEALRRDQHQLDGMLRPLGVDGLTAPVTITIAPLQEAASTAPGPFAEHRAPFGSADQDFHHAESGHDRHPGTDRQARENGSSNTPGKREDSSPARLDRPGILFV